MLLLLLSLLLLLLSSSLFARSLAHFIFSLTLKHSTRLLSLSSYCSCFSGFYCTRTIITSHFKHTHKSSKQAHDHNFSECFARLNSSANLYILYLQSLHLQNHSFAFFAHQLSLDFAANSSLVCDAAAADR